jgi:hypothetical protein
MQLRFYNSEVSTTQMGGTMRLGSRVSVLQPDSVGVLRVLM